APAATEAPSRPAAEPPAAAPPQPAADAVVPPVKREAPKTPAATEPVVVPAAAPAPAEPAPAAPAAGPAAVPDAVPPPPQQSATKSPPPPPDIGGIVSRVQDWLARANREYQGTIVKELSQPSTGGADADAIAAAKKREIEKAVEATKAAEAKRLEDEKKRAEKLKAESAKPDAAKAAEAKAKADELKKAAEKKAADAAKKADAAKAAEDQKAADAAKQAEAAKRAEENKRAEDAAKAAATEKAAAAKDVEADKLRAANEAARLTEQKRADQLRELEAKRKSVEEAQRKSDEAQRRADEAKRASQESAAAAANARKEPRATEPAVDTSKHRRLTITINPEPISRPRTEPTVGRPEVMLPKSEFRDQTFTADRSGVEDGVYAGGAQLRQRVRIYREATYRDAGRYVRGPAVKRWEWRAKYGACRAAGRKAFAPRRYVVRRGDSLWRISERHYNAGRLYSRIYRANRDRIRDPDLIYPCQRFLVPRRA
ncbi:MAG: LysM peptidoglycan-binding domain-containing protein, partial [Parvularculaceae bacterium]